MSSISVSPGETIDLDAYAYYLNRPAYANDSCFYWHVSDNIGTIDQNGVFTAASVKGISGTVSVSFGTTTVSIPIAVGRSPVSLDSFDTSDRWNPDTCTLVTDYNSVKYGTGAVSFRYDLKEANLSDDNRKYAEFAPLNAIRLSNSPDYLSMWVYSDGSGNTISLQVTNSDGQILSSEEQYAMDSVGWKFMTFAIPDAISFHSIVVTSSGTQESGIFIADQLMASYAERPSEHSQLVVEFKNTDSKNLTAYVSDKSGYSINTSDITLLIDGVESSFYYDKVSGILMASYMLDENAHRITLIAKDCMGNLVRGSYDISAAIGTETVFADMPNHWARPYADYLASTGVITGVENDGKFYFNPNQKTTRTEMAVIISRYLGLDLNNYNDVILPFADNNQIAGWAVPYIKAVYAEGLMSGSIANDVLLFNPTAPVTRAEALTILGRTLPQGYTEANLDYKDAQQIAAWTKPHLAKLVALGVVGGYSDNTIKPSIPITRAEVATILYRLY